MHIYMKSFKVENRIRLLHIFAGNSKVVKDYSASQKSKELLIYIWSN